MALLVVTAAWLAAAAVAHAAETAGILISIQGQVEVIHDAQRVRARLRQDLFAGDTVQTGPASRAAILLADESQIKLNANSTFELRAIAPRPGQVVPAAAGGPGHTILQLLRGELWVRNRDKAGFFEIQTPAVTASIRGTEFDLAVAPDGESRVVVLEGVLGYANPLGAVQVAAGEAAVARVGQAPSKVIILRPQDAVQWSLYYPGIVSFRDYPFVSSDPATLERALVGLAPGAAARRGEILHDLGRAAEARAAFEEALRQNPADPQARTGLGWLLLEGNRPAEALTEFRQAPKRLPMTIAGEAFALYRTNRPQEAAELAEDGMGLFPDSPLLSTQAAFFHLLEGRVGEARKELTETLARDPRYWPALGLQANVALVQNQKAEAAAAARAAMQANPRSPGALLYLSLVRQAEFNLGEALRLAEQAAALDPANAQPLMYAGRLLFGTGRIKEAFAALERARGLAPDDPWILTTRGFLLLAQRDLPGAQDAFQRAIDLDSTQGLPYLGLGLLHLQRREVFVGLQALRAATLLEPRSSLFHSYLGKGLWEAGRRDEAFHELTIAKELDPKDPTPHLYSGIFNTDLNKLAQGIQDFYGAIARNDNRAVYRSRLLLDRDLATTNVSLARTFDRFGQADRARSLALSSVATDPSNSAAHLFLTDALIAQGLSQTTAARGELLQTLLLQPVNQNTLASFNDYTSLFDRPRVEGTLTGRLESPRLQDHLVTLDGGNAYIAAQQGVQYFRNTGVHKFNDDDRLGSTFTILKLAPTMDTEVLATFGLVNRKFGDISQGQNSFAPNDTDQRNQSTVVDVQGGIHHRLAPGADLLLAVVGQRARSDNRDSTVTPGTLPPIFFPIPPFFFSFPFQLFAETSARFRAAFIDYQAALLHRLGNHRLTYAFDYFNGTQSLNADQSATTIVNLSAISPPLPPLLIIPGPQTSTKSSFRSEFLAASVHDTWAIRSDLHLTLGLQFDYAADGNPFVPDTLYGSHWNPRAGLTYQLNAEHIFRAAIIRALETHTAARLSPTEIAGFFIEHPLVPSTRIMQYHLGWDGHLNPRFFLQTEIFWKTFDIPFVTIVNGGRIVGLDHFPRLGFKANANYTLTDTVALSAGYLRLRRGDPTSVNPRPPAFITTSSTGDEDQVKLGVHFVHPSGVFARADTLYTRQDLGPYRIPGSPSLFWTTNLLLGYELPRKWGTLEVGAQNLTRERFQLRPDVPFLGDSLMTQLFDPRTFTGRPIVPDRSYFFRVVLNL